MASAESTRMASEEAAAPAGATTGPPLGAVVALSAAIALGLFAFGAPIVQALVPATDLPAPLPDHHNDAETLLFVLAFAVLLPAGIVLAGILARRLAAAGEGAALSPLTAMLAAGLLLAVIAGKLASAAALSVVAALTLLAAAAGFAAVLGGRRLPARLLAAGPWLWAGAALLAVAAALTFTDLGSVSLPVLLVGLLVVALLGRERLALPALPRGAGVAADALALVVILLAVPNLVVFVTGGGTAAAVENTIIQFHQNFFLGPANQILAGDAMLVDTLSQYGVGSIYFLAGLFTVIPISNATLGLIEGGLSALMFAGAWATMRIAGVSRLLAAAAMGVAIVALVYGLQYALGGLLQHGAIRFGMPIGVVVGAVIESRWPERARAARLLQLVTVALASVWALEAFAYTLLTVFAVAAAYVYLAPAGRRRAELARWAIGIVAACVVAHVLLALATLAFAGELPDWGWYLNTLREFLFGQIGDLTYDFDPFSPGLAVGALYVISAAGVVWLLRRPLVVARQRPLLIAIVAMTAFGVALFTYIVNRSAPHIVPYVCLPAVALGALWITLLDRPVLAVPAAARRTGWALGLGLSVLLVAVAASSVSQRFNESALAIARPGGASLSATLDRLWDPPPVRPQAAEGEVLLAEAMPGEERSAVLTSADLSVEILTRAERGNAVPLGDPWEDSFVPEDHLEPLGEYVDGLEPGTLVLLDEPAREAFDRLRRDPSLDPLATAAGGVTLVPTGMATLQEWVLKEIGERFGLREVASTQTGLQVVELVPREPDAG